MDRGEGQKDFTSCSSCEFIIPVTPSVLIQHSKRNRYWRLSANNARCILCLKIHQDRLCASDNRSPAMAPQDSVSDHFHPLKIFFLSTRAATIFVAGERQVKGLLIPADGYMSYGTEQTNQRDMHSRFYFPICEMHIGLHIPVKENIKTIHYLWKIAE